MNLQQKIIKNIYWIYALVFLFLFLMMGPVLVLSFKLEREKNINRAYKKLLIEKNKQIQKLEQEKTRLEVKSRLRIDLLQERVNVMHKSMKRIYPYYDYQEKFDAVVEAVTEEDFNEKLDNMPTDLVNIYWKNYMVKEHGVKLYTKTLKNTVFPMDEDSSAVVMPDYEYLTRRKYYRDGYGYVHIGWDSKSVEDSRVFAIYDMIIHDVKYHPVFGGIVEAKFEYIDESGEKGWYFVRYMHLQNINNFVKVGQAIEKGKPIASMGNTGVFSEGYHCHIELFKWGNKRWNSINFVQNSTWNNKAYVDYKQWLFYNRR